MTNITQLEDRLKLTDLNQLKRDEAKPFGRLIIDTISLVDRSIKYADDERRLRTFRNCDLVAYSNLYGIKKADAYYNVNLVRRLNGLEDLTLSGLDDNHYVTGDKD